MQNYLKTHNFAAEVDMNADDSNAPGPIIKCYLIPKDGSPEGTPTFKVLEAQFGGDETGNLNYFAPDGSVLIPDSEFSALNALDEAAAEAKSEEFDALVNEAWTNGEEPRFSKCVLKALEKIGETVYLADTISKVTGANPQGVVTALAKVGFGSMPGARVLAKDREYSSDANGAPVPHKPVFES
jgi:hypothetical protein